MEVCERASMCVREHKPAHAMMCEYMHAWIIVRREVRARVHVWKGVDVTVFREGMCVCGTGDKCVRVYVCGIVLSA